MESSYSTRFTDDQIVEALKTTASEGVDRQRAPDRIRPANLCAFFNNLPRPERDRLVDLAYGPSRPAAD